MQRIVCDNEDRFAAVNAVQVIGKSGTCSLYSTDYNLHFELSYQGVNINPLDSYNKTEGEL